MEGVLIAFHHHVTWDLLDVPLLQVFFGGKIFYFPFIAGLKKRKKYHMIYMLPLCNSFGQGVIISGNYSSPENHDKSPSHKSHNASNKHHTMHHFVTEMCIHGHISVTKWCIVGYGTGDL